MGHRRSKTSRFITISAPFFTIHLHSIWHPTVITRSAPVNLAYNVSISMEHLADSHVRRVLHRNLLLLIRHVKLSLNHAKDHRVENWTARLRSIKSHSLNAKLPAKHLRSWFAYLPVEPTWSTKREENLFLINVRLTLSPLCRKTHEMTSMMVSA